MAIRVLTLAAYLIACASCGQPAPPSPSSQKAPQRPVAERSPSSELPPIAERERQKEALGVPSSGVADAQSNRSASGATKANATSANDPVAPTEDKGCAQILPTLFTKDLSDDDRRSLVACLDSLSPRVVADGEAEKLDRATARAITLVEAGLARVKNGQDARPFPNVLVNLATELRFRITRTKDELSKDLRGPRNDDYREASARLKKIDEALVKAEGTTAATLARLKKEVQDKIGVLEDQRELLDRSITALGEKDRRVGQAILLWSDSSTIEASSFHDCEILRDDFVALFRPDRR